VYEYIATFGLYRSVPACLKLDLTMGQNHWIFSGGYDPIISQES